MALVTCNQLSQTVADMLAQLNNETMWVQGGKLFLQQGDGRVIQADMVPGMLPLLEQIDVCNTWFRGTEMETAGRKYTSTDVLATCNSLYRVWESLNDRIDNLPQDRFVSGMHSYNPATKMLTLIMSDESVVDIPMSDLIGDILDSIQLQLRDCNGDPLAQDALVPTCAQMNAADQATTNALTTLLQNGLDQIEAQLANYQLALRDANGGSLPAGTQVYSTTETNSAINAAVAVAMATRQPRLRDCNGALIPLDTPIPTCAELNNAIAAAIGSLPPEIHVVSTGGYNAGTGTMNLNMNNGTTVPLNLSALIADITSKDKYVTGGSYNTANDTLTLTMAGGASPVNIVLTSLINDVISTIQHATLAEVFAGTPGNRFVDAQVAKARLDIPIIGVSAGQALTPALIAGTAQPSEVAIGNSALTAAPNYSCHVAVGDRALAYVAGGGESVAVGHMAVSTTNNSLTGVTAVGARALRYLIGTYRNAPATEHSYSVAVGYSAGVRARYGNYSTHIQTYHPSATNNSYGSYANTIAIGPAAGQAMMTRPAPSDDGVEDHYHAEGTISIGSRAGASDAIIHYADIAIGTDALYNVGNVRHLVGGNVAIGVNAGMRSYASGSVFLGGAAGYGMIGGGAVLGGGAGAISNTGYGCVMVGGQTSITGRDNATFVATVTGVDTAQYLAQGRVVKFTGATMTVGGHYALVLHTSLGTMTTQIVGTALAADSIGWNTRNYDLGTDSRLIDDPTVVITSASLYSIPVHSNSTAIGFQAKVTASDTMQLGGPSLVAVRSAGVFYSAGTALTSDARLKSGVKDIGMASAREFVKGLRVVEYTKHADCLAKRRAHEDTLSLTLTIEAHAAQALAAVDSTEGGAEAPEHQRLRDALAEATARVAEARANLDNFCDETARGPGRREAGLIAQEVKVLAEQHGFEYVVSEDTDGVLSLDYNSIQAIINAVVIDALEL